MAVAVARVAVANDTFVLAMKLLKQKEKDNVYMREYMRKYNAKKREERRNAGVPEPKRGRPKKAVIAAS